MSKYTDEYIKSQLMLFYINNDRVPTKKEFTKANGYISNWVIINRFGSWNNGLVAANLHINRTQVRHNTWNKETIVSYTKQYIENFEKYPNSSFEGAPSLTSVKRYFTGWEEVYRHSGYTKTAWTKDLIIKSLVDFYNKHNKVPTSKDFRANTILYPNGYIINKLFGSWNNALIEANLPISSKNGYGIITRGLDGNNYRSSAEAYFCDNYLYNKYGYEVEPRYPAPYSLLLYDWYIKDLDLYIELDGNLRPHTTKNKIRINNLLNRRCLFIETSKIYNKEYIERLIV